MADTAGHEKFSALTPMMCRSKDVCLLVCSIDKPDSIENLPKWRNVIVEQSPSMRRFVIATKVDLAASLGPDAVTRASGQKLSQDIGAMFLQTSAKTSEGIGILREMMCSAVVDAPLTQHQEMQTPLQPREPPKRWSVCCPQMWSFFKSLWKSAVDVSNNASPSYCNGTMLNKIPE
jgi:GTPase SAR1 family protein